jgi:hypothetical protein
VPYRLVEIKYHRISSSAAKKNEIEELFRVVTLTSSSSDDRRVHGHTRTAKC